MYTTKTSQTSGLQSHSGYTVGLSGLTQCGARTWLKPSFSLKKLKITPVLPATYDFRPQESTNFTIEIFPVGLLTPNYSFPKGPIILSVLVLCASDSI